MTISRVGLGQGKQPTHLEVGEFLMSVTAISRVRFGQGKYPIRPRFGGMLRVTDDIQG
jgi:hypothetical protein